MRMLTPAAGTVLLTLLAGACRPDATPAVPGRAPQDGTPVAVVDSTIPDVLEAAGTAAAIRAATVSTRLMGSVTAVLVHEGDRVEQGQLMVSLDARDLVARQGQVVIRPMMNLALTYDHRIVDGRGAVTFLKHIKDLIEDPARMLLEV